MKMEAKNAFVLKNVSAGYGKNTVLKNISLEIMSGKITAVLGANGSGKSTLLRVLGGLIAPDSGEVSVFSEPAKNLCRRDFAKILSFVPQIRSVPSCTVSELLLRSRFPHKNFWRSYSVEDKKIVANALENMGLSKIADRELSTLSGGQRQKAYIAMALCQEASALLLDEPLSFLDISSQFEILEILKKIAERGRTVVIVSHDLAQSLEYSDQIAVLCDGKIAYAGLPDENAISALSRVFSVRAECVRLGKNRRRFVFSPKSEL